MGIEIREVKTKRDLRRFIDFGNELYSNCDNYCPPFYMDEEAVFDRKKNPAYDVSESVEYLAYDDGKIVGRICGIVNRRANEHWKVKKVRFGWFDFIDDERVSRALLDKVVAWGKERGMEVLNGPVGFTDLDHEGLLIEGYEYLAPVASLYNYPYYERHYENYGLTKENDWIEFQITPPDEMPERVARISKLVAERNVAAGYRDGIVRIFNMMTKKIVCELNCNEESENQTLVQVMKWRPKMEGRTNNILMSACRDTIYEWHTPSRKIVYKKTCLIKLIFQ